MLLQVSFISHCLALDLRFARKFWTGRPGSCLILWSSAILAWTVCLVTQLVMMLLKISISVRFYISEPRLLNSILETFLVRHSIWRVGLSVLSPSLSFYCTYSEPRLLNSIFETSLVRHSIRRVGLSGMSACPSFYWTY